MAYRYACRAANRPLCATLFASHGSVLVNSTTLCQPVLATCRQFSNSAQHHAENSQTDSNRKLSSDFQALKPSDTFERRHIGPTPAAVKSMVKELKPSVSSLNELMNQVMPEGVASSKSLEVTAEGADLNPEDSEPFSEHRLLSRASELASKNQVLRPYIGCGYYDARVPEVIKRNILESPAWYTSYTPYQAEISQGRMESLLNFQTMVCDLTGLAISNASLLDEPTAAAEAMTLSMNATPRSKDGNDRKVFFVHDKCHPQTIAVLTSRAEGFGIELVIGDPLKNDCENIKSLGNSLIGALVQYPDTEGVVSDFQDLAGVIHKVGGTFCVATDLLALTLLKAPGEFGADVAFGSSQRFGVPLGFGGPHAAFFACSEKHKRKIPGRLIGVSKDRLGDPALRLALQTREQHIRREKATSNICTAQVLLANMSAFYGIYHGPEGLKQIAARVIGFARLIHSAAMSLGYEDGASTPSDRVNFDTVVLKTPGKARMIAKEAAEAHQIALRIFDDDRIGISVDETTEIDDAEQLIRMLAKLKGLDEYPLLSDLAKNVGLSKDRLSIALPAKFTRNSEFMTNPVFNSHRSETEVLRYIHHLQSKDLSLTHSMIPLGSCTMKLNATTEMVPISWPGFSSLHPFTELSFNPGYRQLMSELARDLVAITGMDQVSFQPNSGAQGEFASLRIIRKYLETLPGPMRDICLIPVSAHGTNPASATMCGMKVVTIKCDTDTGNLDMSDLRQKCEQYKDRLGAIMVTYPSTFGVFEPGIKEACDLVHQYGGQVFMDGANLNAQIGLCSPGEIGADACHLNLHKTFCIPHGGGGPGVGPIAVKQHLASFLPAHPNVSVFRDPAGAGKATNDAADVEHSDENAIAPISGAPYGSAGILPISWAYIKMMGGRGLTQATRVAILNANYIMSRLVDHYKILYTNKAGRCAHEFILDVRPFRDTAGIEAVDIAKRLQDYGFHAPTMSWPVANTLMIEPTESESQAELDRFCDALIQIREEIREVEQGSQPREGNVLKMSPHSQKDLIMSDWSQRPYNRETAVYPLPYLKEKKFWPSVTRLDDAYGDMHLFCTCG